jgi:triosephosphate isomerase (TIM)
MGQRPFIAAANWKMNKTPGEVEPFFQELRVPSNHSDLIVIFPQTLLATRVQQFIPKKSYFQWGGQNCHYEKSGAFTGENSAETLKKLGAGWVLVGHSERRTLFGETDEVIAKKVKTAQDFDLTPMLCLGETLAERDAKKTNAVIERQLNEGLKLANPEKPVAIAYEPVWAIGTGRVATPDQVVEAHKVLRQVLRKLWPKQADLTPILYGGSVTAQNCAELAAIEDVDGFLVGGASLTPESFSAIVSQKK